MPVSNPTETIDPRILRLIGLDDVFDLDYDTYLTLLKEAMVKGRMTTTTIPTEEIMLLTEEYKRVKSKKDQGRFKVERKKISTGSFGVGKIKGLIAPGNQKALPPASAISKSPTINKVEEDIAAIAKSMNSIAEILSGQKKLNEDAAAYEKRKAEQDKRALAESKLEKRFEALKKATEKILAPVKSILDKIINFLVTVFLGRVVYKLIEWFGDPKNADKVRAITRFLGDHWPKLLALYLTFGTSLGRFALGLTRAVARGAVKLLAKIAMLAAAKKMRGARGVARFLGGGKGKLLANVVGTTAAVGGSYALTQGLMGGGEEQKTQGLTGGGFVIPRFSGGGFNFGNVFSGFVSGQKGVDKVPAMLSDGEFVMSRGAVQKYGVDTLEAMNAAGGGTNKPKIMDGTTYAAGGGLIGDIPIDSMYQSDNSFRRMAKVFAGPTDDRFGSSEELYKIFKKLGGVPDIEKMVGGADNFLEIQMGVTDDAPLGAIRQSVRDKLKGVIDPQAAPKPTPKPQSTPKSTPKITRIDASRMLPSAGQSSANAMRAAAKAAQNVRAPIPASRAIVPYSGGGLARTGVTGGLSVPQIRTNMKVPGGIGNLKSLGVELLLNYLMQSGLDYVEAKTLASTIEKARKESPEKLAKRVEKLRELVAREERFQKSFGGILQKVIAMGGETGSEKLTRSAKTILSGLGANTYQGGAIKDGYGLKQQSFKDMPKTQIMTDDKGRPFVGYKAMRAGKPVYVRGPQPGQGTSNPFEAFGRMINPGAYKDIDAANARKKYDQAVSGSISSLRARGASQATIARTQAQFKKTRPVGPPVRPKPRYNAAGGGMGGGRGSQGGRSATPKTPSFSASNPRASSAKSKILNVRGG